MYSTAFGAGSVVLQQGAIPKPDDCMYFLESGEVDVVISGGGADSGKARADDGARVVEGHVVRITQKPGWLFGDIALLFNTPRTASVVAKSDIKVSRGGWCCCCCCCHWWWGGGGCSAIQPCWHCTLQGSCTTTTTTTTTCWSCKALQHAAVADTPLPCPHLAC